MRVADLHPGHLGELIRITGPTGTHAGRLLGLEPTNRAGFIPRPPYMVLTLEGHDGGIEAELDEHATILDD